MYEIIFEIIWQAVFKYIFHYVSGICNFYIKNKFIEFLLLIFVSRFGTSGIF